MDKSVLRMKLDLPGGRSLAAPSWVFPASLAENCEFLSGRVDEAGLLFFQAAPCLAYGATELPPHLAALPLRWHVHLPTDLNWSRPEEAAETCLRLMDKVAFLNARRAVLHPPFAAGCDATGNYGKIQPGITGTGEPSPKALEIFARRWEQAGRERRDILLENQPDHTLEHLYEAALNADCSICFDLAHFLLHTEIESDIAATAACSGFRFTAASYPPRGMPSTPNMPGLLFKAAFLERVRMLHLCAPAVPRADAPRSGHAPLTVLQPGANAELGARICRAARPDTVFMLELFRWADLENSYPLLRNWLETA